MNKKAQLINEIANKVYQRLLVENEVELHDQDFSRKADELRKFLSDSAEVLSKFASKADDYYSGIITQLKLRKEIYNVEEHLMGTAPGFLLEKIKKQIKKSRAGIQHNIALHMYSDTEWYETMADQFEEASKKVSEIDEDSSNAAQLVALVISELHQLTAALIMLFT